MTPPTSSTTTRPSIAVIGLGYVGLPLACLASHKGYSVTGLERTQAKADLINSGTSPIKDQSLENQLKNHPFTATIDSSQLKKVEIIIICVPTPVDSNYQPDYAPVISAGEKISQNLKKSQLIILESTVNPGATEEVLLPVLEKSGLKAGKDFSLAFCPERVDPGSPEWPLEKIPRVVGGIDSTSRNRAQKFYQSIIDAPITSVNSIKAAEASKIVENSFRDVNIAFVNELALSFDRLGIDITEVIKGASTKPFGFMPHHPSRGVGGHCIPVDPYYLIEYADKKGFSHQLLKTARQINNSMPAHTINLLKRSLEKLGQPIKGAKVGLLGLAYKKDIDDARSSPAKVILKLLERSGFQVLTYDPYLQAQSTADSLNQLLSQSDYLILATNHSQFTKLNPQIFKDQGIQIIIDGLNCLDKEKIEQLGLIYRGIGR